MPDFRIALLAVETDDNSDACAGATRRTFVPAVACTLVIAALSLWPKPPQPPESLMFPNADKVVHVVMYAFYAAVLAWTFVAGSRTWRSWASLVAYGAAFGAVMELIQAAAPALERTLSGMDMLANAVGSAVGVALFLAANRLGWFLHEDKGKSRELDG